MRARMITYWSATLLFSLMMGVGGVANLVHVEPQQQVMAALGYPDYLMTLLGIAKCLGVVAILVPGVPLMKEWAYAGFTFDLIGATFSHAAVGDPIGPTVTPLVVLLLCAVSYALRPPGRRLAPPPR